MCNIYILFYTNLSQTQRRTVIIENIDLNTFNQLYLEYEGTLSCPCSEVTISYDTFVSNNVIFHEVYNLPDVLSIADFNNDGYSDIVFAKNMSSFLNILLNKANCNSI